MNTINISLNEFTTHNKKFTNIIIIYLINNKYIYILHYFNLLITIIVKFSLVVHMCTKIWSNF